MKPRLALLIPLLLACSWPARAQPAPLAFPGMGAAGAGPASCVRSEACALYDDPFHAGCGARGGPGCRRANGRCAAWREGFARDCRISPRGG